MKLSTLIILSIIGIFVWVCIETNKESFGQDASIRAAAGWAAGRGMYGQDPVTEFAEQIEEVGERERMLKVLGPGRSTGPREGYDFADAKSCAHSPDCKEGDVCELGTCIPASYEEGYTHPKYDKDPVVVEGMCTKCTL